MPRGLPKECPCVEGDSTRLAHGFPGGFPWDVHGMLMDFPWGVREYSVRCPWDTPGLVVIPMGLDAHETPIEFPRVGGDSLWDTHGLPTGCPRDDHGMPMGKSWVAHGYPVRNPISRPRTKPEMQSNDGYSRIEANGSAMIRHGTSWSAMGTVTTRYEKLILHIPPNCRGCVGGGSGSANGRSGSKHRIHFNSTLSFAEWGVLASRLVGRCYRRLSSLF